MEELKKTELELVRYDKMRHVRILLTNLQFRNMHEHNNIELNILLKGRVRILCDRGEATLDEGALFLLNPYEPHELTSVSSEPVQILSTQLSNHFCNEYFPQYHNTEFEPLLLDRVLEADGLEKLKKTLLQAAVEFFGEEPAFQLACVGHLALALCTLFRTVPYHVIDDQEYSSRKRKTARIHRLTDYIDQHYKEKVLLSELAAMEGVTTTYLSHFFHDTFNMTFQEYLNRLRLEKALILMKDPRLYLVDICMESGFSDNKYLNRIFMNKFGCSAAEYRRKRVTVAAEDEEHPEPASYSEFIFPPRHAQTMLQAYIKKEEQLPGGRERT